MSHRNMKEELTCPICMELFRQPRRLPCGHSYCYICLKAMLDRCTEFSGLYLDYSRSLVCPECREEVSIETDRGVDMIPPDFKLSKLVDLFKFMKKNDSSDSSCDELQSSKPAAPADSAPTPAAAEVISLPATSPGTGPSSSQASHLFTAAATAGRSTQPLHVSPPSAATNASTSTVSTGSQLQSRNTHQNVESSSGGAVSETSSPSVSNHVDAEYNSTQATADADSSTAGPAATHSSEISGSNTCNVDRDARLNNLQPAAVSSAVTTLPDPSQSCVSAVGTHLACVSVSSARPRPVSHDSLTNYGRNPSEEFSSVSEQGPDGGGEALRDNANGSSVRPEQHVDSLEILSNWVNENHCYSQGSRNLSHSAVSLPVEVVLEEAEICHENSPELTCSVAREIRAHSVPTETREWHRSTQPGGSGEHVAATSLHHVKARKVKRGVFSRFVDSDTSSDSSSNNGRQQQRSTGRPKRWLMTRFLRSVILSDSSSTDYSDDDDDDEEGRNATSSKRERKTLHSVQNKSPAARQQSHPQTGAAAAGSSQEAYHQRIPESNQSTDSNTAHNVTLVRRPTDGAQAQAASQQNNLSASEKNRNTAPTIPETVPRSIDSSTLAKETVGGREDTWSCGDTLPKFTHSRKSAGYSQHAAHLPFPAAAPCGQDCHLSERRSQSFDTAAHRVSSSTRRRRDVQTHRTHLPGAGSPPTFYDNLNALSDGGEGRTLYDNVGIEGASLGAEGSQAGLVRDLRLNPCHQQQSLEWTSEHGHGRTLYDNVDSHHSRPEQTSTKPGHIQSRNPVTDIDDLKTGFEHYHTENTSSIEADTVLPDARPRQEASNIQHMGELDNSTRGLLQSSQAGQHASEHLPEAGYVCSSSSSHEWRYPANTGHVPVHSGDHHSLYDNMNNSHSLGDPQGAAGVSKRVRHTEGGTLCEDRAARHAQGEGNRCAGHPNAFNAQGRNGDDELQYVDNYLDHYSEQFRNAASSENSTSAKSAAFAKNGASGMTVGRMKSQKSGVGVAALESAETASSSASAPRAGCGSQATGATSGERRNAESCNVLQEDADSEVVDSENGSNSSTYMQDKKKPRSRLKKFLTSLLSLSSSSSSDDELHPGEASSESSDW